MNNTNLKIKMSFNGQINKQLVAATQTTNKWLYKCQAIYVCESLACAVLYRAAFEVLMISFVFTIHETVVYFDRRIHSEKK